MPTIPPEPAPLSQAKPHEHRDVAESFGADPERYDRTRPRYPEPLVAAIVAATPGQDVLDVGCGTGISARPFQAAGCRVLGIEPDPRMAGFARRGGLDVEEATFEAWDPGGRKFDAVIAGQAWHWVDPVAGAAKAAGVLRPGGRLAVFWNVFQPPGELRAAFGEVYRRVLPHLPMYQQTMPPLDVYSVGFTKAADGIQESGAFDDPEQWRFEWEQDYTKDEWLDQVPTIGGHSLLEPSTVDELLAGLGAVVDAAGGGFTMKYTAAVVTAARA